MESTYNEFQGTEFDPNFNFDAEGEDNGPNLWPLVGAAAGVAAVTGAALIIMGRRRNPTVMDNAQDMLEQVGKEGKKGLKAASKAVEDANLDDLLEDALGKVRHTSDDIGENLEDLLKQAQKRTRKLTKDAGKRGRRWGHDVEEGWEDLVGDTRKRAKRFGRDVDKNWERTVKKASKQGKRWGHDIHDIEEDLEDKIGDARKHGRRWGRKAGKEIEGLSEDLGKGLKTKEAALSALLVGALAKARDTADRIDWPDIEIEDTVDDVRKRAKKALSNGKVMDLDGKKLEHFLEDLKSKLTDTIESVRGDVAPKAMDSLKDTAQTVAHKMQDDVMPAAHGTVEKLREDVIPEAQDRAGKLAEEEIAPRARKAASSVNSLFNTVQLALLPFIEKMVEERVPHMKTASSRVAKVAKEDVMPAAASTAEETVQKVREDMLPRVGEAAAQAPDMLSDIWQTARDRLADAMDKAGTNVSDVADEGRYKVGSVAADLREGKDEVVGAVSSAGKNVTGAMGGAVNATGRATREFVGILFWLAVLGGLVLLVFVPQREKQEEIWNNTRKFMGEVREMWRDLQGPDQYLDAGDDTA